VLADLNIAGATRVAADIEKSGGIANAHALDLASEDSIRALVQAIMARYGRIDILHNNAADTGVQQMGADASLLAMEPAVWDRAFAINTRGTMLMIKHVVPHMIAVGGGSIINTSSGVAILGDVFNPAYSASKAAVNALTRNTAAQFGRQNIRCNAVLPGLVLSPLADPERTWGRLSHSVRERTRILAKSGKPLTKEVCELTVEDSAANLEQLVSPPSADQRMDCFLPIRWLTR
jgi:NAD(P)-dependent dehydrogenase (short-subunit alcohol dehydrogenase family)